MTKGYRLIKRFMTGSALMIALLVGLSGCNSNAEERIRPMYVGQDSPAFARLEFAPEKKLEAIPMHIDNRKMRIWNSDYLPYGAEVDSAYLRMAVSNQLRVTIFNETTGRFIENWNAADTSKIDITGGKLKISIEKNEAPTLTYDLRILGYGYDPNKLTWQLQKERLPVKSDDAKAFTFKGEDYWLTRAEGGNSALYQITSKRPFTFEQLTTAQLPQKLLPNSLLGDHQGNIWILTEDGLLYRSSNLLEWEPLELGTTRLTLLISDSETGAKSAEISAVGYDTTAPDTYYSYSIKDDVVTQRKSMEADFPITEAYTYTYQVAGSVHSNIFSGYKKDGTPATSSFFTSDGISWGETPYDRGGGSNKLPISGGLYLNPHNNRDLFLIGGIYADGKVSNLIQTSQDRGDTWSELAKEQAPGEDFRARYGASGLVTGIINGMPQLYIFGGNINGAPTDEIWHGWLDNTGGILNSFDD